MAGYSSILAQGLLGAVRGGAQAVAHSALQEQIAKSDRDKAEYLAALAEKREIAREERVDARRKTEEGDSAAFYERTAPTTKDSSVPYTDAIGDATEGDAAKGIIQSSRAETRREVAERRLEEARRTGKSSLINQAYGESKDIRAEEEQDRKAKADEHRSTVAERIAAAREQTAATGQARLEAMIAGLIGQGKAKSDLPERKYDAKQWSDAKKEFAIDLVIDDPIAGKSKPDHAARHWATNSMRRLQSAGDIDPADAAVLVSGIADRVTAAAREASKGDAAKYQKFVAAGFQHEMNKIFNKAETKEKPVEPAQPQAGAAPKSAAPQRAREERPIPGRQTIGPLTPESTIQRMAAAGDAEAIEYLERREKNRLWAEEEQLRREQSGFSGEFQ